MKKVADIASRMNSGLGAFAQLYKPTVAAASFVGGWVDASMSAGTPKYNAYVGSQLEATPLYGAGNFGVYVGSGRKRLVSALFQTRSAVVPATVMILDYLMFYPLVDLDSTDEQETLAAGSLPRFADGSGVRLMVVSTTPNTLTTQCTVVYTNSLGVTGRTVTFGLLPGTVTGDLIASGSVAVNNDACNPFAPLAAGDLGVRSIESVTLASGVGGFACFALVKPLATVVVPELNTCSEVSFVGQKSSLPLVESGAYLNYIIKTQATAPSSWLAQLTLVED